MLLVAGLAYIQHPRFGPGVDTSAFESGQVSPRFVDGEFRNIEPTPVLLGGETTFSVVMDSFLDRPENLEPDFRIPAQKTDLKALDIGRDTVVWLGHSSYYVQLGGRRILIDPVFSHHASPVPLGNGAYAGTNIYSADDMPDIDYLLVSHEHWDHLDYPSIRELRRKVRHVVCGLGLDQYFVNWGYAKDAVHGADWFSALALDSGFTIHLVPARHYSVRLFARNQVLWTGFVLETPGRRLYYSGDSGYGEHIEMIADKFEGFDLVMLDMGQYDKRWPYIHMTPEEAADAAQKLRARALIPAHVGNFTIANHPWDEPFDRIVGASIGKDYRLLTPTIGEPVYLDLEGQVFSQWWRRTSAPE